MPEVVPTLTDMSASPRRSKQLAAAVPMTIRLPEHIRRYLIVRATIGECSASDVVRQAIEDAIDREPRLPSDDPDRGSMSMRDALEVWDPEQLDQLAEAIGT
jgi:Arc/MetJ-type ribon-helix-helix transcriptional regulator